MRVFVLISLLAAAAFTTGCQSTHASKAGAPITAITKTVVADPIVESGKAISGTATATTIFIFSFGPNKFADGASLPAGGGLDPNAAVKNAAVYNACQSAGSDIILAPNYVLVVDDYFVFKKVTCTVSGYAGFVKGIKGISTDYKLTAPAAAEAKGGLLPF